MRPSFPSLRAGLLLAVVMAHARGARAGEPSSQGAPTETPSTGLLRVSAGSGGGSVGLTARLGLQLDYWPSDYAGIGVVAALSGQTDARLFGATIEGHWFVGPALSLRTNAGARYAFVMATAGYARGHWTDPGEFSLICAEDCDERPAERMQLRGPSGAFGVGYLAGEGAWRVGVLGLLDLLVPSHPVALGDGTELAASVMSLTLNLTVDLGLY
jgi:hypothetical protein